MNNRLKFNFFIIIIFFLVSVTFFYDEHFSLFSKPVHHLEGNIFIVIILSLGMILSSALYNLSLYFYIKNKHYLYYTLTQLFAILFLVTLDSLYISPFDKLFGLKSPFIFDISQVFMLIFSALFLKEFLQIYKIKNLNFIIIYILILSFIDLAFTLIFSYSFITKFIPIFIPIALILTESIIDAKEKDLPFYILIVAWSVVIIIVTLEYIGFMKSQGITFPFFHIALALESIMLSVAIAYKFRLLQQQKEEQRALLIQQSRLANMGEMISSIVHQWRQPLNTLSFGFMNIKENNKNNPKIDKIINKLNIQLSYMSQTMEDFSNFYTPSKNRTDFTISKVVSHAQTISTPILQKNKIKLEIFIIKNFILHKVQNELEQVILTIILNAKDALVEYSTINPKITIIIEKPTITILDNADAIKEKYADKIFDPYFTTKKQGDGLGLYISKMIIEKEMGGKLYIKKEVGKTAFVLEF